MQKKKIFIEIGVPAHVKKKLAQKIEPWKKLPVKWVREVNLHITVAFLGYVDESVLPEICQNVSDAAASMESFDVEFNRISLGPDLESPQMIWAVGQVSDDLKNLIESIEEALNISKGQRKAFIPHITLGRIRADKWEALSEKPVIDEKVNLIVPVETVFVMESNPGQSKGGPEYTVMETCPLA